MSNSNDSTGNASENEDTADHALRDGLRANVLSAASLDRIRAEVREEWRAIAEPGVRRRRLPVAVAASLVALAALLGGRFFLANSLSGSMAILGQIERSDAPGLVEFHRLRSDVAMIAGANLHAGQSYDVRGDTLIALAGGGNMRVVRASSIEVVGAHEIKLERGEVYVDIPPGSRDRGSFLVVTPAGEFRHVGTQFSLAIVNGQTRLRVREGSVRWNSSGVDSNIGAGTEVLIDQDRVAVQRTISTAGREWAWVESMAPEIEIENRPLTEFLNWFSRETGRKLVMRDEAVRQQAAGIRMHGNVSGLTAMEALSAVMAATTLSFELPEDTIRVSSARESKPPSP